VQADCEKLWADLQKALREGNKQKGGKSPAKLRQALEKRLTDFGHRLAEVKVLDPACGSGNFLYVAINLLLDLEKEVITYGSIRGVSWFTVPAGSNQTERSLYIQFIQRLDASGALKPGAAASVLDALRKSISGHPYA
jgi:hypothetical protein